MTFSTDLRRALVLARHLGEFLDAQYANGYTRHEVIGALKTALDVERALESAAKSTRKPVDNSTAEC